MPIKIVPLGAGQDVGRSCIIAEVGGRTIMLDCGIHMVDQQRFPDFTFLYGGNNTPGGSGQAHQGPSNSSKQLDMTNMIDLCLVTHFHLDHCGALPYFSEAVGYSGPIVCTPPTKAIIPLMLEDFRKVSVAQKGIDCFSAEMIQNCINKISTIQLHETQKFCEGEIKVTAYYAGHVLGACMFHVECNGESLVYTGDFNMSADRHLGAAWINKLRPDVVLTETTYATTIRDSKRSREREFLRQVHQTLDKGGKVLIPVFALGRAQELCILLETYWQRTGLQYPIYFSGGMTEKANFYYKLFINWTNEKIKKTFIKRNMFDFSHVKPFEQSLLKQDTPMVFFATPGMLHGGLSLQTFKEWAGSEKNAVIIPGYCMPGTVGNKILTGEKKITIDDKVVQVKLQVYNMSFSAHADSKGIMELLTHLEPKNVILVHGEKEKMKQLSTKIKEQLKVPCFYPPNYSVTKIVTEPRIEIAISASLINRVNKMYSEGGLLYYKSNSQMFIPQCLLVCRGDHLELTDQLTPTRSALQNQQNLQALQQQQQEEEDAAGAGVGNNDAEEERKEYEQEEDVRMETQNPNQMPIETDVPAPQQEEDESKTFYFENKWTSQPLSREKQISSPDEFHKRMVGLLTVDILRQKKACLGVDFLYFDQEEQIKSRDLAKLIAREYLSFDRETFEVSVTYSVNEVEVGMWLIEIINTKLC